MRRRGRAFGPGRLRLVKRGGSAALWVLDYCDGTGRRRRQSLSSDRRVAERMRADMITRRDLEMAGLGTIEGQSSALAEIRDLYVQDLAQRTCEKHRVNIESRLDRLLGWLGSVRVRDLRPIELMRYRAERQKQGLSNRTINVEVGALKSMLSWAVANGLIAENPIRAFKPLPYREEHQKHVRRALSDLEIEAFLRAAEDDDADCASRQAAERTITLHGRGRHYAMRVRSVRVPQALLWRALIETGARWGEAAAVTWADLDRERLTLTLRATTTKSGRSRTIPLRADLVEALCELRAIHQRVRQRLVQPGDCVFLSPDGADLPAATTGMRRIFRRVLDRAGIQRVDSAGRTIDIHALRHTAASRMARNGVPLAIAQRVLGHASVEMTSRVYTHLDVDDLRAAAIEPVKRRTQTA